MIVAHNNWPDLALAILSALQQTWSPIEVIVVDNASVDATATELPRRFADRLRYIRQANLLDGGGYNCGIRHARGDFVQLLDGDDMLAADKVERQMAVFEADSSVDIVYGDVRRFQTMAGPARWADFDTADYPDMLAALLDPQTQGAGLIPGCVLFRRSVFDRIGPWDETMIGADQDYWLRTSAYGCTFRYAPGALCFYRFRRGQMSADEKANTRRMLAALERALDYIHLEPHRTALLKRLAPLRISEATRRPDLSRPAARLQIRSAYRDASGYVSRAALLAALFLVSVPGAVALSQTPWLRHLRPKLARMLRFR